MCGIELRFLIPAHRRPDSICLLLGIVPSKPANRSSTQRVRITKNESEGRKLILDTKRPTSVDLYKSNTSATVIERTQHSMAEWEAHKRPQSEMVVDQYSTLPSPPVTEMPDFASIYLWFTFFGFGIAFLFRQGNPFDLRISVGRTTA
jgi:hypothetical protein